MQRALVIRGYHGTSATQAAGILRDGFLASDNDYDCLGNGVYFFEDGLAQARAWARRRIRVSRRSCRPTSASKTA